jgi:hypothetical protein
VVVYRDGPEPLVRTHEGYVSSTRCPGPEEGSCRGVLEPTVPIQGQNTLKDSEDDW